MDKDIRGAVPTFSLGGEDEPERCAEVEGRDGDIEFLGTELCVLVLSREALHEIALSLFPVPEIPDVRIMLCRAVLSRTFFSVKGKYSVKWFVISSLGGRCPKKFRSLEGFLEGGVGTVA